MSITGSLVGYENNNDIINGSNGSNNTATLIRKNRTFVMSSTGTSSSSSSSSANKQCTILNTTISNNVVTTATSSISSTHTKHKHLASKNSQKLDGNEKRKNLFHFNTLWSVWYGILVTLLHGYLILNNLYRYLLCSLLQWHISKPVDELNLQLFLCGFVVVLMPIFFFTAIFKIGNLANDGIKLAASNSKCSIEPDDGLEVEAKGGTLKALWIHGGPSSTFIHIISAMCLLIPRLLLEARLIQNETLSKEIIWHTDLDFMISPENRLVMLSFTTSSPYQNVSMKNTQSNVDFSKNNDDLDFDDTLLYDKTDLIEKFHTDRGVDDDDSDMFGKLKIDQSYQQSTITTMAAQPWSTKAVPIEQINVQQQINTLIKSTEIPTTSPSTTVVSSRPKGTLSTFEQSTLSTNIEINNNKKPMRNSNRHSNKKIGNDRKSHKHQNHSVKHKAVVYNEEKHFPINDTENIYGLIASTTITTSVDSHQNHNYHRKQSTNAPSTIITEKNNELITEKTTIDKKLIKSITPTPVNKKIVTTESEIYKVKTEKSITKTTTPPSAGIHDSKIIEIKSSSSKKVKRYSEKSNIANEPIFNDYYKNNHVITFLKETNNNSVITTIKPPNKLPLSLFASYLQNYFEINIHEVNISKYWQSTFSLEYFSLMIALIVWSVRYPSVFWGTSKSFALLFSFQMLINGIDILVGYSGISVLYKLQIVSQRLQIHSFPLLLNAVVTISLFMLSMILIISSSLILYLYGHGRLSIRIRDRQMISNKSNYIWTYFAHCSSLCFVLALAVVKVPVMYDLSIVYRGSLDGTVLLAALGSVIHLLLWIIMWLGLTAKRRWEFKLPPLDKPAACTSNRSCINQPLLSGRQQSIINDNEHRHHNQHQYQNHNKHQQHQHQYPHQLQHQHQHQHHHQSPHSTYQNHSEHVVKRLQKDEDGSEDTIYWPKLNSPKLKVTFNEIPNTEQHLAEHGTNRSNPGRRASVSLSTIVGEFDDGDYATLKGPPIVNDSHNLNRLDEVCAEMTDDTSEEGKLLAFVRDDRVTYASTHDLEPPNCTSPSPSTTTLVAPLIKEDDLPPPPDTFFIDQLNDDDDNMISPLAPVTVTVHTKEAHISSNLTPRCLRRADSGVPTDVLLTPRSETMSTESSTSPPDRAPSETSSGVHSGEEREEVFIRPRVPKVVAKLVQPVIQEEPFGRSTNMRMSSFNKDNIVSATLPLNRVGQIDVHSENKTNHCRTMPLPAGCHQQQYRSQVLAGNVSQSPATNVRHSTIPNGVRYITTTTTTTNSSMLNNYNSNNYQQHLHYSRHQQSQNLLRRMTHVKNAESPYGILGLGAGHHTFSKLLHDPIMYHHTGGGFSSSVIPEDLPTSSTSSSSEQRRESLYGVNNTPRN